MNERFELIPHKPDGKADLSAYTLREAQKAQAFHAGFSQNGGAILLEADGVITGIAAAQHSIRHHHAVFLRPVGFFQHQCGKRAFLPMKTQCLGQIKIRDAVAGEHDEALIQKSFSLFHAAGGAQRCFFDIVMKPYPEILSAAEIVCNSVRQIAKGPIPQVFGYQGFISFMVLPAPVSPVMTENPLSNSTDNEDIKA